MSAFSYDELPCHPVETQHRRIAGPILPPERIKPWLADSKTFEPRSIQMQPPVMWDKAEGFNVFDATGNKWIDFSSGVLVANAGHGRPEVSEAIVEQAQRHRLHTFGFANEPRIELAKKLVELAPDPLSKALILTIGSETTEVAIRLMRTFGRNIDDNKRVIVSFDNAFHGHTMGARFISGIPALKEWIGFLDPAIVQVPFPDGFRWGDTTFHSFERSLEEKGIEPKHVAGVICESFQGAGASFGPKEYFQELRQWCEKWNALLTFDEVQAGFGRSGRLWSFEHYEIVPDLICLGKGMSSSVPVSAVVGRPDVMDLYPPGSMRTTHAGNPICCAAALANIKAIEKDGLVENAARVGSVLHEQLWEQLKRFDQHVGAIHGQGLVAGVHVVKDQHMEPNKELAHQIVWNAVGRGLMLFAPVGFGGATIKICPPLCITEEAVTEGVRALVEAFAECCGKE